ncbi:hypothetical protein [Lacihabitans soyangensis]|uniref:hypothetical protein n=1 Tax=Lacihabitans soyangensis TaxID=869394 RepID=UPI0020CD5226|nr:hypothetical protein [Lacihabitans soyangensis]
MEINRNAFLKVTMFVLFIMINFTYRNIIIGDTNIYDADYYDPNSLSTGKSIGNYKFVDLVLTDSILYNSFFDERFTTLSAFILLQGNFAVLGISLVAFLIKGIISHFVLNMVLCFIGGLYLLKMTNFFNISGFKTLAIIFFYPYTIYYCQSINKEIFLLTLFIVFIYAVISKKYFLIFLTTIGVFIIKFFFVFICLITILFHFIKIENNIKSKAVVIVTFIVFGTFTYLTQFLNTGSIVLENAEKLGLANRLNNFQDTIPFISYFTFPIKFLMNTFEGYNATGVKIFYPSNYRISVVGWVSVLSFIYIFHYFIRYFIVFMQSLFTFWLKNENSNTLYFFTFVSTLVVLTNSFIHNRYFFFLIPFYVVTVDLFKRESVEFKANRFTIKLISLWENSRYFTFLLLVISVILINLF